MTTRRTSRALALVAGALMVAACGGAPPQNPNGTPAVTVTVVTENNLFIPNELTVPADAPFAVTLENRDVVPHNIAIEGPQRMASEIFGGPAERTTTFSALPAGTYGFLCEVHPEMRGTLVSR